MGRGRSKANSRRSEGGRKEVVEEHVQSIPTRRLNQWIREAEQGDASIRPERVQDIKSAYFGIATYYLNDADRSRLEAIVDRTTNVPFGANDERNTSRTVNDIHEKKVARINLSEMTSDELKDVVRICNKANTAASVFCMSEALELIKYYNARK